MNKRTTNTDTHNDETMKFLEDYVAIVYKKPYLLPLQVLKPPTKIVDITKCHKNKSEIEQEIKAHYMLRMAFFHASEAPILKDWDN